jgi:periplasmic protein TonB
MAVNADIFFERESLRGPLLWSAILHGALFASIGIYSAILGIKGANWGSNTAGGGEAMSATLVTSIPLPTSNIQTPNVLANESKGLTQSLPKTVQDTLQPEAIPIPERESKKKPEHKITATAHAKPVAPVEQPSNVVPYGEGGPLTNLYGFSAAGTKGGFGFSGGAGDFGSRYGWYVDVVRRKVSDNWLKYEVDPRITTAARCFITFDITRSGQPSNIRVEQTSGVPTLDISAMRALQRIDSFGPLPSDYSGSKVSVEFWFDYRR